MSRDSSSLCSARMRATLKRISPRFGAGIRDQAGKAALAASTAAFTSAAPEAGKVPMTSSWLAGLTLSKVAPDLASTQRPPIRFLKLVVAIVTGGLSSGTAGGPMGWRDVGPIVGPLGAETLEAVQDQVEPERELPLVLG